MNYCQVFVIFLALVSTFYRVQAEINLALKQPASQSGTYGGLSANIAVDGIITQVQTTCSHTTWNLIPSWWQVNLQAASEVKYVKIYYRKGTIYRLNGFELYMGMDDKWNGTKPCYKDNEEGNPPSILRVNCTGQAQYITIVQHTYDTVKDAGYGPMLELCEVQVFGCVLNTFGPNCMLQCHCRKKGCNLENGICYQQGCEAGWKGDSCNTTCDTNKFGEECKSRCHCLKGSCSPITGICYDPGCKPGYRTETCSKPCTKNTFGLNCSTTCHCNEGSCHHEHGTCFNPGCKAGWKGDSCNITCETDKFGPGCISTCYCLNGTCSRTSGICKISGCEPGYKGETCSNPCVNNTFGSDCNTTCYCYEGSCNHVDGKCIKPGCKAGWEGDSCTKECENETFGFNCMNTCYCLKGGCNHQHGECFIQGCKDGWKGSTCSELLHQVVNQESLNRTVGISVGIGISLILIGLIIAVFVWRSRRKGNDKSDIKESKVDDAAENVYDELDSPEVEETSGYTTIQRENAQFESDNNVIEMAERSDELHSTVIKVENMKHVISENTLNGEFEKQHKYMPFGPLYQQTVGKLMKNKKKNRNQFILPYDHSRVVLESTESNPSSDYINASYIKGLAKDSNYIATQGPMKNTLEDFWRMVWQTKSSIIIMLVNVTEDRKVICSEYWPVSTNVLVFAEFEIILNGEENEPEVVTRKLKVKHSKTGEVRTVWHLQFTSWPNYGIPNPFQLLLLHRKYIEIASYQTGPPIIHCSDGIGRTGVFIACDAMSKKLKTNAEIDVCKFIMKMRKNRMNMVDTKETYILVHEVLLEILQFQNTSIPKHDFLSVLQEDGHRKDQEYEMIANKRPNYDETFYTEAMFKKNRGKNRNQSILPVDMYRPTLKIGYINAVTIPSCKMPKQFLVTQIPLQNTVLDLWRMVEERNTCTIVNLEDTPKFEQDLVWYPTGDRKLQVGNVTLMKTSESSSHHGATEITLKTFDKESGNEKIVKLFRYLNWKHDSIIPTPQTSFLEFIALVLSWNKSINNGLITVICADGAKCCGLFCLIYSIIENLSHSEEIDIYRTARLQQIRRPQFLSLEQYHLCYNIIQEYIENAHIYCDVD